MNNRGVFVGFWAAVIACATFLVPAAAEAAAPPKAKARTAATQPVAHGATKAKKKKHKPGAAKKHAGKKHPAAAAQKVNGNPKVAHKQHAKNKKNKKKHKKWTANNTHAPMKAKPKPTKPVKPVAKPKPVKPTPID